MRIAYCILCHKFTPTLVELVRLVGEGNEVFVHVDAKASLEEFRSLDVKFVEPRVDVRWGRFSLVEATLRLLEATRASECDHIAVISGDTLPVGEVTLQPGKEYMYELPLQPAHIERVRKCHPAASYRDSRWAVLRRRLGLLPRNRGFDRLPPLHFGSNWFIITPQLRDYILAADPEYIEAFRRSNCGDELFFITLAANSPFAEKLSRERYMYVDWERGPDHPRTLDETDFERVRASGCIFARKFGDDIGGKYTAYRA